MKSPTGTISYRFPRAVHNVKRHTVSISKTEGSALMVQVHHFNDVYELFLSAYEPHTAEYAYVGSKKSMPAVEVEK